MDAAQINSKIYYGRSKVAAHLGVSCDIYRPVDATQALGNKISTFLVSINSGDQNYHTPNLYNDPIWYADYDGAQTRPGDYIVRADGAQDSAVLTVNGVASSVWFVCAEQMFLPIVAVECNRFITLLRASADTTPYTGGVRVTQYGGETPSDMTPILGSTKGWPGSILIGGRIKNTGDNLPTTVRDAGWMILLPPSVPFAILSADILQDDLGKRYAVESAEQTDLGWRLVCTEEHP